MSAADLAIARLKSEEGFRSSAYLDSTGRLTIGYGFSIAAGITKTSAAALLAAQVQERAKTLEEYDWFQKLDEVRASVFLDLSFNNGVAGLLHFTKTIAAAAEENWAATRDALLDSKAAKANPARYGVLAQLLFKGVAA